MWSTHSYTICDSRPKNGTSSLESDLLLQGLELDFDVQLHLPVVSAVSKMSFYRCCVTCRMLTTTIPIEIGDVLFCVNSSVNREA